MNTATRRLSLSFSVAAVVCAGLLGPGQVACAQSPLFPNTRPIGMPPPRPSVSPANDSTPNLPSAFQITPPLFSRPQSSWNFNYRTSSRGIYNSPYAQPAGNSAIFNRLGN